MARHVLIGAYGHRLIGAYRTSDGELQARDTAASRLRVPAVGVRAIKS